MASLKAITSFLKISTPQTLVSSSLRRLKRTSPCDHLPFPSDRPCFDINSVIIERGGQCHAEMVRSFLYNQYWPREPSVVGMWLPMNCCYLEIMTDKHANSGDRFLAFERELRTNERKLIGVAVGHKQFPWSVSELEEWAHYTFNKAERDRMYFNACLLKCPDLFKKYCAPYIYEIEVLCTSTEVTGQGVGTKLLRTALDSAQDLRHPLVQVSAVNKYAAKICERCGMEKAWSMKYADFVDGCGQRVFFPRRPHLDVEVYIAQNDRTKPTPQPCKPQYQ